MQLQTYTPDQMPELVKYQILSFMRTEWPQGFSGRFRGRRWISLPEFNPTHFVLMDADFVVGHAEAIWRDWTHRGETYRVYGMSGVFVYDDYRGAGYGKQLVNAVTDHCAAQPDADIGMLWCAPHLRDFYIGCGWELMDNTTTLLGDTAEQAQAHDDEVLFMRFFSAHGQANKAAFVGESVYFGWTTW